MMRRSLVAAVAVAPLLAVLGGQVRAETQITTATTAPVATATVKSGAPDDITITSAGSVSPTAATSPAVTLNSSNAVTNAGAISFKDLNNATGIQVLGGNTGQVTNSGTISITESYAATDTNSDGVVDGPWSKQTGGTGVQVSGGVFTGGLTNTGGITVQGNGGRGISIQSEMTGSLLGFTVSPLPITSSSNSTITSGSVNVTGDNAIGVSVTTTGKVDGDVKLGTVTAQGAGATAVSILGGVGGAVVFNGAVTANGYRTTSPTTTAATLATYTADELQQSGSAVVIGADIGKGILITGVPKTTDATNPDSDSNGIPDAKQAGAIAVYGSAPAVQIGVAGATVSVGNLTQVDTGYGFVNQGSITASGIYTKATAPNLPASVSATAVQIGVTGDSGSSSISGGVHNTGTIAATALDANATGVFVTTGGTTPKIVNDGTIVTSSTSNVTIDPGAGRPQSTGILIGAGANVASLTNTGTIAAVMTGTIAPTVTGTIGDAGAIVDKSGTLLSVANTGTINATVSQTVTPAPAVGTAAAADTPTATAIDLSMATSGATIAQTQSTVTNAAAPTITGAIRFGSGADLLSVQAGTVTGNIDFGAGADTLTINGDANTKVTGAISDSDGALTINVMNGTLSNTSTAAVNVTSVNVGSSGTVLISADPANNKNTTFVASGNSTIGAGATFGLTLQSLQTNLTQNYTVIQGAQGSITASTFGSGQLSNAPFFFAATTAVTPDRDQLVLTVTRKSAAQLGFNSAEAAAYDQVFNALVQDSDIQKALLAQTTRSGLVTLYDQLLPDQGQGVFDTLDQATQSIAGLTAQTPDAGTRVAGTSLWLQEVNERVKRRSGDTLGSQSQMFGLVGGYERMGAGGGALGVTFSYMNIQDRDSASAVGEHTVASLLEAGAYYRRAIGGLRFSARGAGGYAFFHEDRQFVYTGVSKRALSNWGAFFADAHVGTAYEVHVGRFYARPEISADYLYLRENGHTESGGGNGFDLSIASRASHRLSGEAILTLGTQFGRDTWLRPEIRGGYRKIFSGNLGDTTAQFTSSTTPFTLSGAPDTGGWFTVGFSLKGGTNLSYLAIEGDADFRDGEQRYDLFLSGRSMF